MHLKALSVFADTDAMRCRPALFAAPVSTWKTAPREINNGFSMF